MSHAAGAAVLPSVRSVLHRAWETHGILLVTSQVSEGLDQWGRAFAREVRSRKGANLEIYMPATRDSMIARFNELLSGMSLETARSEPLPDAIRRFILVPDIRTFDSSEGLLLARLASDFPGAATRLVLLIDQSEWLRSQTLIASLGRHVHRVVLPGSPIDRGASEHGPADEDRGARVPAPQSETVRTLVGAHDGARRGLPADSVPSVSLEGARRARFNWLGVGALVMLLLLVSALIVVLLHRERGPGAGFEPRAASEQRFGLPYSALDTVLPVTFFSSGA